MPHNMTSIRGVFPAAGEEEDEEGEGEGGGLRGIETREALSTAARNHKEMISRKIIHLKIFLIVKKY